MSSSFWSFGPSIAFLVFGVAVLGAAIWAVVDLNRYPDWTWQQIGQNKGAWIAGLLICGILSPLCCFLFTIAAIALILVYFLSTKKKLDAAQAGGYGMGASPFGPYAYPTAPGYPPPGGPGGYPPGTYPPSGGYPPPASPGYPSQGYPPAAPGYPPAAGYPPSAYPPPGPANPYDPVGYPPPAPETAYPAPGAAPPADTWSSPPPTAPPSDAPTGPIDAPPPWSPPPPTFDPGSDPPAGSD